MEKSEHSAQFKALPSGLVATVARTEHAASPHLKRSREHDGSHCFSISEQVASDPTSETLQSGIDFRGASVAQGIEQDPSNVLAAGSNPAGGTILPSANC